MTPCGAFVILKAEDVYRKDWDEYMENVKGRGKEFALDLLYDVVGGFLQAIGLHCFIDSIDIAPGGATGLAILLNRFTHLPLGTLTFMINIPLLIASWTSS